MSSSKPTGRGASGNWSDGETTALVQAWGQLYLHRNRLSDAEWLEVCGAVNAHRAAAGRRFDRSVVQCRCRLYALKSQYKKEIAKNGPSGWRHFAQLRAFLAGPDDDGSPSGFAAMMPPASVKEEEGEEASGAASGSVGRRTVPAKRKFSSLHDILDRSVSPPPGFPPRMPATVNKEKGKAKVKEEVKEEVGRDGPSNGAASAGSCPAAVVTKLADVVAELPALVAKLADVYERVEMERLSVEKGKLEMEWEERAAKVEAESLGETDEATTTD